MIGLLAFLFELTLTYGPMAAALALAIWADFMEAFFVIPIWVVFLGVTERRPIYRLTFKIFRTTSVGADPSVFQKGRLERRCPECHELILFAAR